MKSDETVLRLQCLGDARIITPSAELDPSGKVVFAVALYLILERNGRTPRRVLQEIMWPGIRPEIAAHRLRQALFKLRRLGIPVEADGKCGIILDAKVVTDFEEFERSNGTNPTIDRAARPLFFAFNPPSSRDYEEWLDGQREHFASRIARVVLPQVEAFRVAGDWRSVEVWAKALLCHASNNEEATLALAESLAMRGDKIRGVQVLDSYLSGLGKDACELRILANTLRRRIADRMPVQRSEALAEIPFIGREDYLRELVGYLYRSKAGVAQSCVIVGQAGIGKSRLVSEFLAFASLQGVISHRVFCRASDAKRPLSILLELIPLLRSMRGSIGSSPETLDFLETLTTHRPSQPRRADAPRSWDLVHFRLDSALVDLIDAVTEECTVALVFEDCQWLDRASAAVLERLLLKFDKQRLFLIFTSRSVEGIQATESLSNLPQISLPPLPDLPAGEIVQAIGRQSGKEVKPSYLTWCTRVAEGNAFFLQELASHWVETGDEHGAPPSLTALLGQRLSRLSRHAVQVLQTCSILENHSTLDTIEAVLGYAPHELLRSLNELATAGMVTVTRSNTTHAAIGRVSARHDLLSDIALTQLAAPARAYLHCRAAKVLESRIAGYGNASILWSCAKHWQLAGDNAQAFRLTNSCARHLLEAELPSEAAEAFSKSIEYCTNDSERLSILEGQATASYQSSDWLRVMDLVPRAKLLKQRLFPNQGFHDDLELMLRRAEWQTMNWEHILADSLECLDAVQASARHRLEAGVMALMLLTLRGDSGSGTAVFDRMTALADEAGDAAIDLILQAQMIFNTWWGSVDKAVAAAISLVAEQRKQHNTGALLRSLCNAGISLRVAGQFEAAANHLHEALSLADCHRVSLSKAQALPMLAHMAIEQGQIDKARESLCALRQVPVTNADTIAMADIYSIDARLALLDGRYETARNLVECNLAHMRLDPLPHKRAYWNALHVATDLATNGYASPEALQRLETEHINTRGHPFQAFAAFALYTGLMSIGENHRAKKLLNEYITVHRREKWAAPQHLLDSLAALIGDKKRTA